MTKPVLLRLNKLALSDSMKIRDIVDEQVENWFGRDDDGERFRYEIYIKVQEKK